MNSIEPETLTPPTVIFPLTFGGGREMLQTELTELCTVQISLMVPVPPAFLISDCAVN